MVSMIVCLIWNPLIPQNSMNPARSQTTPSHSPLSLNLSSQSQSNNRAPPPPTKSAPGPKIPIPKIGPCPRMMNPTNAGPIFNPHPHSNQPHPSHPNKAARFLFSPPAHASTPSQVQQMQHRFGAAFHHQDSYSQHSFNHNSNPATQNVNQNYWTG